MTQPPYEERSSPAEVVDQVNIAKNLLALGMSREQVYVTLAKERALTPSVIDRRIEVAKREMKAAYSLPLVEHRELQHARLLQELAMARASGKHAAAARYEEVLMKLLGTAKPVKLSIDIPNEERERVLNVMMLLDSGAIAAVLGGSERVALGHAPRTLLTTSEDLEEAGTPSPA